MFEVTGIIIKFQGQHLAVQCSEHGILIGAGGEIPENELAKLRVALAKFVEGGKDSIKGF